MFQDLDVCHQKLLQSLSGSGSDGNEVSIPHFPDLQNWSLNINCSLRLFVFFCLLAYQPLLVYLMPNPFLHIY